MRVSRIVGTAIIAILVSIHSRAQKPTPLKLTARVLATRTCSGGGETLARQLLLRIDYYNVSARAIDVQQGLAFATQIMVATTKEKARSGDYLSVQTPETLGMEVVPPKKFVKIESGGHYSEVINGETTIIAQLPGGQPPLPHAPHPGRYFVRLMIPAKVRSNGRVALINLTTDPFAVTFPPNVSQGPCPAWTPVPAGGGR